MCNFYARNLCKKHQIHTHTRSHDKCSSAKAIIFQCVISSSKVFIERQTLREHIQHLWIGSVAKEILHTTYLSTDHMNVRFAYVLYVNLSRKLSAYILPSPLFCRQNHLRNDFQLKREWTNTHACVVQPSLYFIQLKHRNFCKWF